MSDIRKVYLKLRQDAIARGMTELAIAYGISYIRLSQDFVNLMLVYEKLKHDLEGRP